MKPMGKRKLEIRFYGESIKNFKYFEWFFFTPCFYTLSRNTYNIHERYYFTRTFCVSWLFFTIEVSWKYGKVSNNNNKI